MFFNIGIVIAVTLLVLMGGGFVIWRVSIASKYRYLFWVWSKDLSSHRVVRAKLAVDKDNKNNRVFRFKNNPSILIMRDAVHWDKGRSIRWVIPDETGEYQYLGIVDKLYKDKDVSKDSEGKSSLKAVDNARYMQTRLHPVDKQLYCEQIRNNVKRYENKNNAALGVTLAMIGLAAILMIGMIYGIGIQVKNGNAIAENSRILSDMTKDYTSASLKITESMRDVTINLAYIYGQLNEGVNGSAVIRPVGGLKP